MRFRLISLLVLGTALASCAKQPAASPNGAEQILRIGNGAEPKDLDPTVQASIAEFNIETALFEGLVTMSSDGHTIQPGVAEKWEVSEDGLTYTFHLRANARWSDGSPLTADDFVYSFRRLFSPALAAGNAVMGYPIVGAEDLEAGKKATLGVAAPDPRTFVVTLRFRAPYMLDFFVAAPFVPVQRAAVERFGGDQLGSNWTKPGNLVSNGPFMLKAWRPNQDVTVVHNPYYWDEARTKLQEIRFLPTEDTESEERMFRTGQIDVTYALPENKIDSYRGSFHADRELGTYYLSFNVTSGVMADVRVRRALALAIDRDRIIPLVMKDSASPAHTLTRPGTAGYAPVQSADYDPVLARRLLAEAGFPGGAGFPAITLCLSNHGGERLCEAIQEQWRKVLGLHVSLESQELKTLLDRLATKNYQVAYTGYIYSYNAPEAMLMVPLSDSNWNYFNWKSPVFDAAYDRTSQARENKARFAACDDMERTLSADVPISPIDYPNRLFLVNPKVKGWRDNDVEIVDWRELSIAP